MYRYPLIRQMSAWTVLTYKLPLPTAYFTKQDRVVAIYFLLPYFLF